MFNQFFKRMFYLCAAMLMLVAGLSGRAQAIDASSYVDPNGNVFADPFSADLLNGDYAAQNAAITAPGSIWQWATLAYIDDVIANDANFFTYLDLIFAITTTIPPTQNILIRTNTIAGPNEHLGVVVTSPFLPPLVFPIDDFTIGDPTGASQITGAFAYCTAGVDICTAPPSGASEGEVFTLLILGISTVCFVASRRYKLAMH